MTSDYNFAAMSLDALWQLHEEMRVVLAAKMMEQRQDLDARLRDLEQFTASSGKSVIALRPHAGPFYRNPDQPSQIWSGRGLRPRWLVFHLAAGRKLDEFRIVPEPVGSAAALDAPSDQNPDCDQPASSLTR